MGKKYVNASDENALPRNRGSGSTPVTTAEVKPGDVLVDLTGKKWKLGDAVGIGGFGEIFLASDDLTKDVDGDCRYVAKIELHKNGPLFVEINCYLRIAKENMINEWKNENDLDQLGMPQYFASGSHYSNGVRYRFLIIPRFKTDLEAILEQKKRKLNLKTVLLISLQLIDILQYIHSKGFIHADVKASNILLAYDQTKKERKKGAENTQLLRSLRSCRIKKNVINRKLRSSNVPESVDLCKTSETVDEGTKNDQIYLLDYGLAAKYLASSGEHKPFCEDQRKAHAGTMLFCSVDAHRGAQSRRSDLESLAYNIIYWLTSSLPWINNLEDPEIVQKKKRRCMTYFESFLAFCFNQYPTFLYKFLKYINTLEFSDEPDYDFCRNLFKQALKEYGCKNNKRFDFDNIENLNFKKKGKSFNHNNAGVQYITHSINRTPLKSNLPIKPVLRKKNKKLCVMNWSKILMDPECILKKGKVKERRITEPSEFNVNLSDIDINELNPTEAMLDVYNGYMERINTSDGNTPTYKGDGTPVNVKGYTSAMTKTRTRMLARRETELEKLVKTNAAPAAPTKRTKRTRLCKTLTKSKSESKIKPKKPPRRTKSVVRTYSLRG